MGHHTTNQTIGTGNRSDLMNAQMEFFNRVASSWDQSCHHDMSKVESILDLAGIQKGSRILDVGTGTGVLVPSLARRVAETGRVRAVDVAEKMIEVAAGNHRYGNVEFECRDALVHEKSVYDHVICYSMFPHFQDKREAIEKLAGKVKSGGCLMICHSQSRLAINRLHRRVDQAVKNDELPSMEILKGYFIDSGLSVKVEIDDTEMFVIIGER